VAGFLLLAAQATDRLAPTTMSSREIAMVLNIIFILIMRLIAF
jgi:hypothetical protein